MLLKYKILIGFMAVSAAVPAAAQVALDNHVYREVTDSKGTATLVTAKSMLPGTVVVYQMTYRNNGAKPASNLVIENRIPANVVYIGAYEKSPAPQVSVDGGRTYGALTGLRVSGAGGLRAAQFSDVTNVRWVVAGPVAPRSAGSVGYKARVR